MEFLCTKQCVDQIKHFGVRRHANEWSECDFNKHIPNIFSAMRIPVMDFPKVRSHYEWLSIVQLMSQPKY